MAFVSCFLPENPWVVQVVLTTLYQQDCELSVEIGQTTSDHTSCRTAYTFPLALGLSLVLEWRLTPTHNDVDFFRYSHGCLL